MAARSVASRFLIPTAAAALHLPPFSCCSKSKISSSRLLGPPAKAASNDFFLSASIFSRRARTESRPLTKFCPSAAKGEFDADLEMEQTAPGGDLLCSCDCGALCGAGAGTEARLSLLLGASALRDVRTPEELPEPGRTGGPVLGW